MKTCEDAAGPMDLFSIIWGTFLIPSSSSLLPLYPFRGHREGAHTGEGRAHPCMSPHFITEAYMSFCGCSSLLHGTLALLWRCSGTFAYYQNTVFCPHWEPRALCICLTSVGPIENPPSWLSLIFSFRKGFFFYRCLIFFGLYKIFWFQIIVNATLKLKVDLFVVHLLIRAGSGLWVKDTVIFFQTVCFYKDGIYLFSYGGS